MKTLFNNMVGFNFNEFEFNGIALNKYLSHPYSNKKEAQNWRTKLIEEGSEISKSLIKEDCKKTIIENMHINISLSYISTFISIVAAIIALLIDMKGYLIISTILMSISTIFFILKFIFNKKAEKAYYSFEPSLMIIDMIFEMKKENK